MRSAAARAYPVERILSEKLIEDRVGSEPVIVVAGPDGKSIRVFRARLHSGEPASDYYLEIVSAEPHTLNSVVATQPLYMDSATGSEWSFTGCAVNGRLKGACLEPVSAIKDYWFDWRNYHPDTTIFRR